MFPIVQCEYKLRQTDIVSHSVKMIEHSTHSTASVDINKAALFLQKILDIFISPVLAIIGVAGIECRGLTTSLIFNLIILFSLLLECLEPY